MIRDKYKNNYRRALFSVFIMILNFATWNIGGGILWESYQIDGKENIPYYAKIINKYSPDILCLQEAHSYGSAWSQANILAEQCGYSYVENQPISPSHLKENAELSLSTLSKFPIISTQYTVFENPHLKTIWPNGVSWNLYDKWFLTSEIDFHGVRITIINVHFFPFHYFWASAEEWRFSHILDPLRNILTMREKSPTLLGMDFNHPNITLLNKNTPYQNSFSLSTTPKWVQQDFILYNSYFSLLSAQVLPTESDHHFCTCTFSFDSLCQDQLSER